ncbi:MAG: sulfite exporter TauE/SafE family protein, partial [Burkholderiales bacterium]
MLMDGLLAHSPLLLAVAFVAGALNAVAGGGSFLTLPALIFVGLPSVSANATGTVAMLPGYASSTFAFRKDLRLPSGLSRVSLVAVSLVGGALGAVLLVVTPNHAFDAIVPWLLLVATAAFAFGPRLMTTGARGRAAGPGVSILSVLAVTIYGGYFNGGVGIILLAVFNLLGLQNLNAANGLKNLVSLLLTAIAVAVYAWGGAVSWPEALLMM